MSRKRDMYINRKNSYSNRRRRNDRRKGRSGSVVIIAAVLILLIGIYGGKEVFIKTAENNSLNGNEEDRAISGEINTDQPKGQNMQSTQVNTSESGQDMKEAEAGGTAVNSGTLTDGINNADMQETFKTKNSNSTVSKKVKGIYITGPRAGKESSMKELLDLVDTTELNAMVIDFKNDNGEITYKTDLPEAEELQAGVNYIADIKKLIADLKAKDVYLIARVVAFKDPLLAKGRPELSLKNKNGSIFYDKSGLSWVNPYKKEVWEYLVSVAEKAVQLGFDEIQFDYIRFSTDSGMKNVDFGREAENKSKMEVISEFTKYACDHLKPLGVYVSADVYGTIIDSKVDAEIVGQNYKEMAKYLDYICPMIYPSHYGDGSYGIQHPDLKPYELIFSALNKSQIALESEGDDGTAVVRPWLQDFTATWVHPHISYGPDEIKAQIKAVYDAGYEEWILWNGNNNYTKDGLNEK